MPLNDNLEDFLSIFLGFLSSIMPKGFELASVKKISEGTKNPLSTFIIDFSKILLLLLLANYLALNFLS